MRRRVTGEIFLGIITRQAIRRGSFDSVRELTAVIRRVHRSTRKSWDVAARLREALPVATY
jgi:hypothetical protein